MKCIETNLLQVRVRVGESRCAAEPAANSVIVDVMKGFHGSGRGGLVMHPSLRSLSADSNTPSQRKKLGSSRRVRGRLTSSGKAAETGAIDYRVESESSTTLSTILIPLDGRFHYHYRATEVMPNPTPDLFARTRRIRILVSSRWMPESSAYRASIARP